MKRTFLKPVLFSLSCLFAINNALAQPDEEDLEDWESEGEDEDDELWVDDEDDL